MTLALALALTLSANPTVELFKDKGDTFIKAGTKQGLKVGMDVTVLGDPIGNTGEYRSAGSATVMEVWETVARVSLDEEAKKHKEAKRVALTNGGGGGAPVKAAAKAAPAQPLERAGEGGAALNGRAKIIGFGPARQITVYNSGTTKWTNCEFRLPTNQRFKVAMLEGNDQESVVLPKFQQDGVEYDKPLDHITVKCDQGQSVFQM